ncbi:MAG TPA: AAA family ATPase, partial [Polyangiaceae bacterium]|nr:AAA family ATPase [Polyangiaceae bacterium]
MRIARLELVAFGPFTERRLDFSAGVPGGLHLVYGANAAGKSTALRAISDLLFGIPQKTGDDHVHPYQALRIRACLQDGRGQSLVVQRLKRAKDALRDEADQALDETVLSRLLGGVDRNMFERVFGLDHERLREAGQMLLKGGGDVGESLFDAGAGGHSVRRVLERLEAEADKLFKPRGKHASINELVDRYKLSRKRVSDALRPPEAYVAQVHDLEKARAECDELKRGLSELREERFRKRELQGALKSIARRAQLLSELELLGPLPNIPEAFIEQRERAQATIAEQRGVLQVVDRELSRLTARRDAIKLPEG